MASVNILKIEATPSENDLTTMASSENDPTTMATSEKDSTTMVPKKPKIEPTQTTLSEYEQQREENIRRNREMISSLHLLQKSSDLSSLLKPSKKPCIKRTVFTKSRESLRCRGLPPPPLSLPPPRCLLPFSPSPAPKGKSSLSNVNNNTYLKEVQEMREREYKRRKDNLGLKEEDVIEGKNDDLNLRFDLELKEENVIEGKDNNFDLRVDLELKEENVMEEGNNDDDLNLRVDLELEVGNVIERKNVMALKFLPVSDREIVITGHRDGYLRIWDASLKSANNVHEFFPHRSLVYDVSVHPFSPKKIYSACYGGDLCSMDFEREMFNMVYSSDDPIYSLCQSPDNHNLLYLGYWGPIKSFDERMGKICNIWELHNQRINTIDYNSNNSNIFATCCTNGFARIWDLRKIDNDKPECVKEIKHAKAVHSSYFSPSGTSLVSTRMDGVIRVSSGSNYDNLSIIKYSTTSTRAIWGWSDSYILIGSTKYRIDIISTNNKTISSIDINFMPRVPRRIAINPYKEGHLVCASDSKLHLWTKK